MVHARLHDGHLPEACFGWESLERLAAPQPAGVALRPLVRRLFSPPIELPARYETVRDEMLRQIDQRFRG